MISRLSLSIILVLAVLIWGATLWFLGIELSWDHAKPFSATLLLLTLILMAFDRLFWKVPPISWLCPTPNLNGTWKAEIKSTYVDPDTGKPIEPIRGFAAVRQTFSTLSVRLMTDNSASFLVAHKILKHGDGAIDVLGVYQSDPEIHLRGIASEIHYGSFRYKVVGSPPKEMQGHFWTDRNTRGSIRMVRETSQIIDSLGDAQQSLG